MVLKAIQSICNLNTYGKPQKKLQNVGHHPKSDMEIVADPRKVQLHDFHKGCNMFFEEGFPRLKFSQF